MSHQLVIICYGSHRKWTLLSFGLFSATFGTCVLLSQLWDRKREDWRTQKSPREEGTCRAGRGEWEERGREERGGEKLKQKGKMRWGWVGLCSDTHLSPHPFSSLSFPLSASPGSLRHSATLSKFAFVMLRFSVSSHVLVAICGHQWEG